MKKNFKYILYSLLTTYSIICYFDYKSQSILSFIFAILLFLFYKKFQNIEIELKYKIFLIIMSFSFVVLYSYEIQDNGLLVWGNIFNFIISIIKTIGYYLFFKVLIAKFIEFMKFKYVVNNKFLKMFQKHAFLYSFIFLSISFSILLIFYYPGILNYDNANQIKGFMGFHTRYLDAINPIKGSTLTQFNPIVHTFLLGSFFKLGFNLGNQNFGIFLYTIFQLLIIISIYSYIINYAIKLKINPLYSLIILIILVFYPLFGFYGISVYKDVLYTAFLLLFSLKIYDFILKKKINNKDFLLLFIYSMLVCLFRNNGIVVIIPTLLFLLYKKEKLRLLTTIFFILSIYLSFTTILLPKLKVSSSSIREIMSVPFQQTARYVIFYENELSNEDKAAIAKILDYKNLQKDYNKNIVDKIKGKFNKDATITDLKNYFIVWNKGLIRHPLVYLDAFINNSSGYIYPFQRNKKIYYKLTQILNDSTFHYHYNKLEHSRELIYKYEENIENSPFGIILNIAIITWLNILIFIMLGKKYCLFLLPSIITIIMCFLSPANAFYIYIYPSLLIIVLMFPFIKDILENKNN